MCKHITNIFEEMNITTPMEVDNIITEQIGVKKIIGHDITPDGWTFKVVFEDNSTEWIKDEDCSCEKLISEYLHNLSITTGYVICRVSTKNQATLLNLSLAAQESEILPVITKNHYRLKIIKISASAYKKIPKELLEIEENLKKGDGLYIWRVDRLSRNIVKYLSWLEDLNNRGIIIYSASEGYYYHSNKLEFLQAILDAQREAEILGTRVKLANRLKQQRGDQAIGNLPYGKKYERLTNHLGETVKKIVVDNCEEQEIISYIKTNKHMPPAETVTYLNTKKIHKRGRKWTISMIKRMQK
jgi:DNA invertase Pin-like site-specific DNA recombinase